MEPPPPEKPPTMYKGPPPGQGRIRRRAAEDGPAFNPVTFLGIPLLLLLGGYAYLRGNPDMAVPAPVAAVKARVDEVVNALQERIKPGSSKQYKGGTAGRAKPGTAKAKKKPAPKKSTKPADAAPPAPLAHPVTLYLTNGGVITGDLVDETPTQVIVRLEYGDVGFNRSEIQLIKQGADTAPDHDITLPWESQDRPVGADAPPADAAVGAPAQ